MHQKKRVSEEKKKRASSKEKKKRASKQRLTVRSLRWEADDQAGVGRVAYGGGGRGWFGMRGLWSGGWSLMYVRESGKCESETEKCGPSM